MKRNYMKKFILSAVLFSSVLVGCTSSDDSTANQTSDDFNRQVMLSNWADNIIIPAFEDLSADLSDLVAKKEDFITSPNQTNLDALRASWLEAYKTWQYVEMFNIGKAEELSYAFQMNVYPTNVSDIEANIISGNAELSNVNNNDAVGFPAVDYMINGIASNDSEIIAAYSSMTGFQDNQNYLSALIDQMKTITDVVLNDWNDSYRDIFVANIENSATGSVNKLTNDFIFYYEKGLRANKIGIPAGVFSTEPLGDRVEALYYGDASKTLALEGLNAVQDFFNGKSYNGNATDESFKSYLDYLNTIKNGEDLSALVNDQFNQARAKIQILDTNLQRQVEINNIQMTEAYDELQKAVVLLKIDMIQAMNISVDFVDADGD